MTRPRLGRPMAVLIVTALLIAACGSNPPSTVPSTVPSATTAPSPTTSADAAATYEEINTQVQQIRGLDEKEPVHAKIVSGEEMSKVVLDTFHRDNSPEQIALDERLYHALGLMPADANLGEVYDDLLSTQVAGLYDPQSGLYVRSKEGGVGPVERVFYSHEYDHALQDQHFDLTAFQKAVLGHSDRQLARQALVEGDAYVLMTYWLQQNLTGPELGEVIAAASDPVALAALERIPPIVQAQITFAALQGTQWVLGQQVAGGWEAIDRNYAAPPESTEQILHEDKWTSREAPVAVELPGDLATRMGQGWSVALENTMGEFQTGIWLGESGAAAAVGWGGDRITLLDGPNDAWAIAWQTAWDTATDASEFESAAEAAVGTAGGPGSLLPGAGGTTRWVVIGSDATVLGTVSGALGLAG